MNDVKLLFSEYQGALISEAEKRLNRKLTDIEASGIKGIYSFLMLEAIEMTILYDSNDKIEDILQHYAAKT